MIFLNLSEIDKKECIQWYLRHKKNWKVNTQSGIESWALKLRVSTVTNHTRISPFFFFFFEIHMSCTLILSLVHYNYLLMFCPPSAIYHYSETKLIWNNKTWKRKLGLFPLANDETEGNNETQQPILMKLTFVITEQNFICFQ